MLSMEVRSREIIRKIIDKELDLSWKNLEKQQYEKQYEKFKSRNIPYRKKPER